MTLRPELSPCGQTEPVCAHAVEALPAADVADIEAHIASCDRCRQELGTLRPVIEAFVHWPTDILRAHGSLQERLLRRIAAETGSERVLPVGREWRSPEWADVSSGIRCKVLSVDRNRNIVTMLVQLAASAAYPPHVHAGVEELYLLDGELWIDGRKLHAGDYHRAEPGTSDARVWTETGCTCVLITSTRDAMMLYGRTGAAAP